MQSKRESTSWRRVAAVMSSCVLACLPAAGLGADVGVSGPPAVKPRAKMIVDHAVVPAGGLPCRHCGAGACRVHGGHLAGCRNGLCAPHCPVRPSQYGFYHTQWRRWPGQGVVPASAEEAATPVAPPASQVPTIDEESPSAGDRTQAEGENPEATEPRDMPPATARSDEAAGLTTDPIPEPPPRVVPGDELPATEQPVPPSPPGDAPQPPGKDADGGLFDQSALPIPEAEIPLESGAMRYPAPVGRSLVAGVPPWRLLPQGGQRAAASVRGR